MSQPRLDPNSEIITQTSMMGQQPMSSYIGRTPKQSKNWIGVLLGLFVIAVLVWFFVFKEDDAASGGADPNTSGGGADPNTSGGGADPNTSGGGADPNTSGGGCKDGEEMVGTKCLVKCEDGKIRVGEVCELVNLTAHRTTERPTSRNTTTENNITIDAYGLGSWYNVGPTPPLIKEVTATWDGCKDACVADKSCKAFTRFHTTKTYNQGGLPCNLYSQNFPHSEVTPVVGHGWGGELVNIVGR